MKVTIVGTGYVGLVTGACLADCGHEVFFVDKDENKINLLKSDGVPIYEPGLKELLEKNKDKTTFTTHLLCAAKQSEVVIIAVGTPSKDDGSTDTSAIESVAELLGQFASDGTVIVNKSTAPVGTCDKIEEIIRRYTDKVYVVSNPEFLREGTAINDFMDPDRVVLGIKDMPARIVMDGLYHECGGQIAQYLFYYDRRSAELIKYASNAFLAMKISFINEIASLCEAVGANIDDVSSGIGLDDRIGDDFLNAGIGWGGSCFPKDVDSLLHVAEKEGVHLRTVESARLTNIHQRLWATRKIMNFFKDFDGGAKKIAVWGLSFKANTDDVRCSSAVKTINLLASAGIDVCVYDPQAKDPSYTLPFRNDVGKIVRVSNKYDAVRSVDALVIATDWGEFAEPDYQRMRELMSIPVIFDGRNVLDPEEAKKAGFTYIGVGRL